MATSCALYGTFNDTLLMLQTNPVTIIFGKFENHLKMCVEITVYLVTNCYRYFNRATSADHDYVNIELYQHVPLRLSDRGTSG